MINRNRSCALAVAIAALWTAAQAPGERNGALWQLSEEERFYLLKLAGGMDSGENNRSGRFRSSAGRSLNIRLCTRYIEEGRWVGTSEREKICFDEFPPMMLKRMHDYGYKGIRLEDVADIGVFSFYKEMRKRTRNRSQEERNKFLQGYLDFKKRLGVFTSRDRALEESLKPPKKYIIRQKRQ